MGKQILHSFSATSATVQNLARDIATIVTSRGTIDPARYTPDELSLLFELFEQVRCGIEAEEQVLSLDGG